MSVNSREALMRAAERCVAQFGLAGSPLTVIHRVAGQRNASATQYHFGSRDGLINALLDERMPPLNADRMARLDALIKAQGPLPALRDIVDAWVQPLAQQLHPQKGGNFYLRFLDRLRHEGGPLFAGRIVSLQEGYRGVFALVEQHLRHLRPGSRHARVALAAEQLLSSLARLELELERQGGAADFPADAVETLVDYIAGGLAAPEHRAAEGDGARSNPVDFRFNFLGFGDSVDADDGMRECRPEPDRRT